jgi:hypothetical protein
MSENVEASNSHNPKGLHGLYRDNFTLLLPLFLKMEACELQDGESSVLKKCLKIAVIFVFFFLAVLNSVITMFIELITKLCYNYFNFTGL